MPQITINVNGTNYTVGYDGTFYSPQGMLIALNNLGFGIFYINVDGATNYLTTVDNTNVYGNITTFADPITMTTNASCSGAGFDGQGVIDVTQFVGGDGYYEYIAIGATTGEASANVQNPLTRDEIIGLGSWQFQDLVNGTYFIAIMDADGNIGISEGVNVSCTPIPNTTTTTTTTTTAAPTTTTTSTTSTTTAAPTTTTTTTSTTSTTTTAAPTTTTSTTSTSTTIPGPTTTSTTTTTTTLFAQTVNYGNNAADACLAPTGTQNVTGNATDFCSCTIFNSAGFVTLANGNYVLAYGGNTLNVNISGAPTTTAIVYGGGCGTCPLSTSTTTSTTTPTQVWYTLTQCYNGTLTTSTNYNSGTFSIGDIVTYSNTIYFTISGVNFTDPGGIHYSITSTGLLACPSTTTTTTTTTLPPITFDETPSCYGSQLNGQGQILINNFAGGSGSYSYAAIGTSEASAFICIANPACRVNITGELSHNFTSLTNGDYWIVVQDSVGAQNISAKVTVSCNATTTTTTTTTLAPVTFTLTPTCQGSGIPGSGSIFINNFAGGNNDFVSIGFATTLQDAIANVIPLSGATSYTWYGLSNITYYVVLRDSLGNFGYNYTTIACNASTSTTTTTTTQAPVPYTIDNGGNGNPYAACNGSVPTSTVYAAPGNTVPIVGLILYTNQSLTTPFVGGSGYRKLVNVSATSYAAIVDTNGEITSYSLCSSITTSTTTTTTTAAPVTYTIDNGANGSAYGACSGPVPTSTVYAASGNTVPIVGLILYTNQDLTTPFVGSAGYRKLVNPSATSYAVVVDANGQILSYSTCASVTTSTTTTTTTQAPVPYTIDNGGNGNAYAACNGSVPTSTVYAAPGNTVPIVGLILYTNQSLTTPFVGGSGYRKLVNVSATSYAAIVDTNGQITSYSLCSSITTSTTTTTTTAATTTTTTTTTSSTTTTTTQAPVPYTIDNGGNGNAYAACNGSVPTSTVYAAPGNTVPIVGLILYTNQSLTTPFVGGSGYRKLVNVSATSYAAIVDTNGQITSYSLCSSITTSTTTTTTTAAPTTTTSTTTTTSSTTTTTTQAAVTASMNGVCTGLTQTITVSGFSGGDGSTYYASDTTYGDAVSAANGAVSLVSGGSRNYTGQPSGTRYVKIASTISFAVINGGVPSCTTTSTTTTTTTAAPVTYTIDNGANGSAYGACSGSVPTSTVYAAPGNTVPIVGLILYTNQNLTSPFVGGAGYRKLVNPSATSYAAVVDANGQITSYALCSSITTTTSTTTSTTTLGPTYVWAINSAALSPESACSSPQTQYVWTFGSAFTGGITFYADNGSGTAPAQPIQPFLGGGYYYQNGGNVLTIDDNGNSANFQPCPTTTTTIPLYSLYLDCGGAQYYTYGTTTGNGFSNEVPEQCVLYQGQGAPSGTFFTNFIGGDCFCP